MDHLQTTQLTRLPETDDEDLTSGSGIEPAINPRVFEEILPKTLNNSVENEDITSFTTLQTIAPTYKASLTLLIVVSVIAILVLIALALATLKYRLCHKGSYHLGEFNRGKSDKDTELPTGNVYDQPPVKEFML